MNRIGERSEKLFKEGYCCAESSLMALAEEYNITSEIIPRIASGFCSGIARTSGMCGAVSGAIMGIGLVKGRNTKKDKVEDCYGLVQKLIEIFSHENGSINCSELINCDLNTTEGKDKFKKEKLGKRCSQLTGRATEIASDLLRES